MNDTQHTIPVIWLKCVGFIRVWLENTYGDKRCDFYGKPLVPLESFPGAFAIYKYPICDDSRLDSVSKSSISAFRMDIIRAALHLQSHSPNQLLLSISDADIEDYVPVSCPGRLIEQTGIVRSWNRSMYFSDYQVTCFQKLLHDAFVSSVCDYAASPGAPTSPAAMSRRFCREYGIPISCSDDIRRIYLRETSRARRSSGPSSKLKKQKKR